MRILCTKKEDDTPAKCTTTLLPRHQNCIRNGRLGHTWTTPNHANRKQVPANSMLPFDKIPSSHPHAKCFSKHYRQSNGRSHHMPTRHTKIRTHR